MRLFFGIVLAFCLIAASASALYTSDVKTNGGGLSAHTSTLVEGGSNIMKFGTVDGYYTAAASTTGVITTGITGSALSNSVSGTRITNTMQVQTYGSILAYDGAGMNAVDSNVPDMLCDEDLSAGLGNTTIDGQYPSDQGVDGEMLAIGSGTADDYAEYNAGAVIDEVDVGLSASFNAPQGSLIKHINAYAEAGDDKTNRTLNYYLTTHETAVSSSNETSRVDTAFYFVWRGVEVQNRSANISDFV